MNVQERVLHPSLEDELNQQTAMVLLTETFDSHRKHQAGQIQEPISSFSSSSGQITNKQSPYMFCSSLSPPHAARQVSPHLDSSVAGLSDPAEAITLLQDQLEVQWLTQ